MNGEQIKQVKAQDRLNKINSEILNMMHEYRSGNMLMIEFFVKLSRLKYKASAIDFSSLIDPATGLRYPEDM